MARFLYTSDTHFNHPMMAKTRGFTTIDGVEDDGSPLLIGDTEAHDETVIENWNSAARKDDIIFLCGDFAMNWRGVSAKLARLKGRKILIEGNHDIMWSGHRNGWKLRDRWIAEDRFEAIQPFLPRKIGKREILMSHFPYEGDHTGKGDRHTQFRLRDEGKWLLHGHTHSRERLGSHPRQLHVGMDAWNLHLASEGDIIDIMNSADARHEVPGGCSGRNLRKSLTGPSGATKFLVAGEK